MERINPRSRADQYGRRINREQAPWLAYSLPYLSIMLGSLVPALPLAVGMPILPPLGFLMLIGWRIMRPGMLPLWAGFPLGAFDDLFSGQPFGSAILFWSLAMIVIELIEARFPWRGFWQDWFTAGITTTLYLLLSIAVSGATPNIHLLFASLPQVLLSVLLYPIIARMVAWLDTLRLTRIRVIG
ncbi:rod shape-determining protein MreD [Altererythrobacter sp.]|uniref:rod shape-determining protein MreD n=1 Tax=Altererythrobacter sp. TaxID=1872480 RepID=UPI003D00D40C